MFRTIIVLLASLALIKAEDLSGGGDGTNVEFTTGYHAAGTTDTKMKPAGTVYAYLGGKVSQAQPTGQIYQDENYRMLPGSITAVANNLGLTNMRSAGYFGAGAAAALSAYYLYSIFSLSGSKKALGRLAGSLPGVSKKKPEKAEEKDKDSEGKSRRRRSIKDNEELTNLATIVLNAVQSGECLQKTICLVGQQVTDKKGKITDTLLSTLLPASVQQTDYYIVLKRSLRGEINCNRFRCPIS